MSSGGGPASARPDLFGLLYLNPELEAYCNCGSIEAAAAAGYGNVLPSLLPILPENFDARVYLAAQADVSGLNAAIRQAMLNSGMTDASIHRRGAFVSTFMIGLALTGTNTFQIALRPSADASNPALQFSSCNLAPGDCVRLLCDPPRGRAVVGRVVDVLGSTTFTFSNALAPLTNSNVSYTLQGLKIWDPERQARVAYVRKIPYGAGSNDRFQVPRTDFREDVYQTVYPDSRPFNYANTYLDYVHNARQGNPRIANGDDIVALGGGGGGGGGGGIATGGDAYLDNLVVAGSGAVGNGNLIVTPQDATLRSGIRAARSNLSLTSSNLTVGRSASNLVVDGSACNGAGSVSIASSNVTVTPYDMYVRSDVKMDAGLTVAGGLGIGFAAPEPGTAGCSTRLSVDGDIFATGTVISLSDARAKTNIERIDRPLERLAKLRGVTFETVLSSISEAGPGSDSPYQDGKVGVGGGGGVAGGTDVVKRRRHTGLLAQDVEDALPEAIYEARSPANASGMKMLRRREDAILGCQGQDADDSASASAPEAEAEADSAPAPLRSVAYGNLVGLLVEAVNSLASQVKTMASSSCSTSKSTKQRKASSSAQRSAPKADVSANH